MATPYACLQRSCVHGICCKGLWVKVNVSWFKMQDAIHWNIPHGIFQYICFFCDIFYGYWWFSSSCRPDDVIHDISRKCGCYNLWHRIIMTSCHFFVFMILISLTLKPPQVQCMLLKRRPWISPRRRIGINISWFGPFNNLRTFYSRYKLKTRSWIDWYNALILH